jgi:hypothetical protein
MDYYDSVVVVDFTQLPGWPEARTYEDTVCLRAFFDTRTRHVLRRVQ